MKIIGIFLLGMFAWTLLLTQAYGWPIVAALLFSVALSVISMRVYVWVARFFTYDYWEEREQKKELLQQKEDYEAMNNILWYLSSNLFSTQEQGKKLSEFTRDYPHLKEQLLSSKIYKTWKADLLEWFESAKGRGVINHFYFEDGETSINYTASPNTAEDYKEKMESLLTADSLSTEYEDDEIDTDSHPKKSFSDSTIDSMCFGIGMGVGIGLVSDNSDGGESGDCDAVGF